ncbi:phosphoribosylformylglycinamidine cyclo-ligase [Alkaliphilus peptidifermentans]|uniref:Phosphoribosylformylglycinamidine cyclo-ligase n=1 Tax=Alkaliphilus peptidifermentans DSM 18978 TaxID=1120976 RepID=A0A1G5I8T8_9FIRM|nr:phosphoribosylformylglycinamidine cyclo-ligase [Alkaliphilus peptidifermentans]SCY72434.1 phosphoribosylformylglycinamidine cyclo-ligase [Alkaliphilus peptidifermentans DSM 18978]
MDKLTYSTAGVDVDEGQRAVDLMKQHVKSTFTPQVLTDIGGFGGLFALDVKDMKEPILVSGTDGVGTKLKIAFMTDRHDTIGQDCVAMCVNDILCQGAKPLFFLDYIATGRLQAEKAAEIVKGIAMGCKESGCSLIGGETAEMPGFYQDGEYDVAGFAVGIVDRQNLITGEGIIPGDIVIGIPSSGIHSNGFSLVRKLLFDIKGYDINSEIDGLEKKLGNELLTPTKIYVKPVLEVLKKSKVKGIVHITGGGFFENIPRILPQNTAANIKVGSWPISPIFNIIQQQGNIDDSEMFKTFNMGIGMMLVVDKNEAKDVLETLAEIGEKGYEIGNILEGQRQVVLCQG